MAEVAHDCPRWSNRARTSVTRSPKGARPARGGSQRAWVPVEAEDRRSGRASRSAGRARHRRPWHRPPRRAGTGRNSSTISSAITGWWWNGAVMVSAVSCRVLQRRPPGPRSSAAPRSAVAAGMSPRRARRKRAELGLSILPTGRLRMSGAGPGSSLSIRSSSSSLLVGWVRSWAVGRSGRPSVRSGRALEGQAAGGVDALEAPRRARSRPGRRRPTTTTGLPGSRPAKLRSVAVDGDAALPVDGDGEGVAGLGAQLGRGQLASLLPARSGPSAMSLECLRGQHFEQPSCP